MKLVGKYNLNISIIEEDGFFFIFWSFLIYIFKLTNSLKIKFFFLIIGY